LTILLNPSGFVFSGISKPQKEVAKKTIDITENPVIDAKSCSIKSFSFLAPYMQDAKLKKTNHDLLSITIKFTLLFGDYSGNPKKENPTEKLQSPFNCTHVIYFSLEDNKQREIRKYNIKAEDSFTKIKGRFKHTSHYKLTKYLNILDDKPVTKTSFDGWILNTQEDDIKATKNDHLFGEKSKMWLEKLSSYFQALHSNPNRVKLFQCDLSYLPTKHSFLALNKKIHTIQMNIEEEP
jgi:hypothetical protein